MTPATVKPTPETIRERLGSSELDRATLAELYRTHARSPVVAAKRRLWARLLATALGTQFDDDDALFVDHTLLVTTAALLAHGALGEDLNNADPRMLLSGELLAARRIHGVVERDCFDWLLDVPGGDPFVRPLARRLARFDWTRVEHDLLKVLYESVIAVDTRRTLGEYYTPDWLAEQVVAATVDAPLSQRVMDPSCGSGTFLFHAARHYLDHATADRLPDVTRHVIGIDLHPDAVALARVTYLLALGLDRIDAITARGELRIPVFLGDSMQWQQHSLADRVDVLLGNPPWLAYRFMPDELKTKFAAMSDARKQWRGAKHATNQDLSALFVTRTVELFLKENGKFGFVMPAAVLDRGQYAGFRRGDFDDEQQLLRVAFTSAWDLRRVRPHFFPIAASVVFGRRSEQASPLPQPETWSGKLPPRLHATWAEVAPHLTRVAPSLAQAPVVDSPYRRLFFQGATIVPRVLFMVEIKPRPPLGLARGLAAVRSVRSATEKPPWKDLPALDGVVESAFVRRVHLGETLLPYRVLEPRQAVIPRDKAGLMTGDDPRIDGYPALAKWWRRAEAAWREHRTSDKLSLIDRLDYHRGLSNQFPHVPPRVVYTKSGMHLAAAWFADQRVIVDHSLYWASARSEDEARYLCAILNATITTTRVRPSMSYGKDERHIDKFVWGLPIPLFDDAKPVHRRLAALAADIEEEVDALDLPGDLHFAAKRRRVREFLATSDTARAIEALVTRLLDD